MNRIYLIQMEEFDGNTVNIWEDFYDYISNFNEAKKCALDLVENIKSHKVREVLEVSNPNNTLSIVISAYGKETNCILDVIEIEDILPKDWNVTCGSCGAYCSEGICYKYEGKVNEDTIACDRWHEL